MRADIQNGIIVNGDDTKKATTPRGVAAFFCARSLRASIATAALHVISIAAVSIGKKHSVPAILSLYTFNFV